jgi:hypothetical protein
VQNGPYRIAVKILDAVIEAMSAIPLTPGPIRLRQPFERWMNDESRKQPSWPRTFRRFGAPPGPSDGNSFSKTSLNR